MSRIVDLELTPTEMDGIETKVGIRFKNEERDIFNTEYVRLVEMNFSGRAIRELFDRHQGYVYESALRVKGELLGSDFQGMGATSNGIGWMITPPNHLLGTSTPAQMWRRQITQAQVNTANGWINWIASQTSPSTLNQDVSVVVIGHTDPVPGPKTAMIKWFPGNVVLPVYNAQLALMSTDSRIHDVGRPFRIAPRGTFAARTQVVAAGLDELQPLAISIGRGTYLSYENAGTQGQTSS